MRLGLVGLPWSGKTTLFRSLTGVPAGAGRVPAVAPGTLVGVARIPDARLDVLAALYRPRKVTPAQIEVVDIPGVAPLDPGAGAAGVPAPAGPAQLRQAVEAVAEADALGFVIRAFDPGGSPPTPARDFDTVLAELVLADLGLVEARLERLDAEKRRPPEHAAHVAALARCRAHLEAGLVLRALERSAEERALLSPYRFLTDKPGLVLPNVAEAALRSGDLAGRGELEAAAAAQGFGLVVVSAQVEAEIAALDPAERDAFLAEFGLREPGVSRIARAVYAACDLVSFFTVGDEEVKAWTVPAGTSAHDAAGKIHTDLKKGFIRAEVVAFADLERLGSMRAVREAGRFRLEGKEYAVRDGDILTIRFSV